MKVIPALLRKQERYPHFGAGTKCICVNVG